MLEPTRQDWQACSPRIKDLSSQGYIYREIIDQLKAEYNLNFTVDSLKKRVKELRIDRESKRAQPVGNRQKRHRRAVARTSRNRDPHVVGQQKALLSDATPSSQELLYDQAHVERPDISTMDTTQSIPSVLFGANDVQQQDSGSFGVAYHNTSAMLGPEDGRQPLEVCYMQYASAQAANVSVSDVEANQYVYGSFGMYPEAQLPSSNQSVPIFVGAPVEQFGSYITMGSNEGFDEVVWTEPMHQEHILDTFQDWGEQEGLLKLDSRDSSVDGWVLDFSL